jgi:hypothetical protein
MRAPESVSRECQRQGDRIPRSSPPGHGEPRRAGFSLLPIGLPAMFLQYHNFAKLGFLPYQWPPFGPNTGGINTRMATAVDALGHQCFLILGAGQPRRTFYLWEAFTAQGVDLSDYGYDITGTGWMLNPPRKLEGTDFRAFQKACEDFRSFRPIADMPYAATLQAIAQDGRRAGYGEDTLDFCDDFAAVTGGHAEAHLLRAYMRHQLGDLTGALADCRIACASTGIFDNDAAELMAKIEGAT